MHLGKSRRSVLMGAALAATATGARAQRGWEPMRPVQFEGGKPYVGGWNLEYLCGVLGVAFVVLLGSWIAKRNARAAGAANS